MGPESDWDFTLELNLRSAYRMIRSFLPAMLESGKGASIINMSSSVSSLNSYARAKRALDRGCKPNAQETCSTARCSGTCWRKICRHSRHARISILA